MERCAASSEQETGPHRRLFYFCHRSGWLTVNPITNRSLGRIKVEDKPTDYFTPQEFDAILDATLIYRGDRWKQETTAGTRLRALTLLMRWTGLRIRDAVTLEKSRLAKTDRGGDCIFLYQAKTGEPVYCPIPPHVADECGTCLPASSLIRVTSFGRAMDCQSLWSRTGREVIAVAHCAV